MPPPFPSTNSQSKSPPRTSFNNYKGGYMEVEIIRSPRKKPNQQGTTTTSAAAVSKKTPTSPPPTKDAAPPSLREEQNSKPQSLETGNVNKNIIINNNTASKQSENKQSNESLLEEMLGVPKNNKATSGTATPPPPPLLEKTPPPQLSLQPTPVASPMIPIITPIKKSQELENGSQGKEDDQKSSNKKNIPPPPPPLSHSQLQQNSMILEKKSATAKLDNSVNSAAAVVEAKNSNNVSSSNDKNPTPIQHQQTRRSSNTFVVNDNDNTNKSNQQLQQPLMNSIPHENHDENANNVNPSSFPVVPSLDDPFVKPKSVWYALVVKNPFTFSFNKDTQQHQRPHVPPPGSLHGYSIEDSVPAAPNNNTINNKNDNSTLGSPSKKRKKNVSIVAQDEPNSNKSPAAVSSWFDEEDDVQKYIVDNNNNNIETQNGSSASARIFQQNTATHLMDEDLSSDQPNDFQKLIEIILRLKKRQFLVLPNDVVEECDESETSEQPWNFLNGFRLNPSKLVLSPDRRHAYFRIHVRRASLLAFAEKQCLSLKTNPFSFRGGGSMVCTRSAEIELKKSCQDYMKHFVIPDSDSNCRGKNDQGFGFFVDVPEKMHLFEKLIGERWIFGGCGIPFLGTNNNNCCKNNIIINFFPLHNETYLKEFEIENWASFSSICSPTHLFWPVFNQKNLRNYFGSGSGEKIIAYFEWLRQYVLYLVFPSVIGVACGVVTNVGVLVPSCFLAVYAILTVIYMPSWIRKWERYESRSRALSSHNDTENTCTTDNEILHDDDTDDDDNSFDKRNIVDFIKNLFEMNFETPTPKIQKISFLSPSCSSSSSSFAELQSSHSMRLLRRYLISYLALLVFAAGMVAALYFTQVFRFRYGPGDMGYSIAASVISVAISAFCCRFFDVLGPALTSFENPRSKNERDSENAIKSFAFYFAAKYFVPFTILLWPSNNATTGVEFFTLDQRLFEFNSQLVCELAILPFFEKFLKIALPRLYNNINNNNHNSNINNSKDNDDAIMYKIERESSLLLPGSSYLTSQSNEPSFLGVVIHYGWTVLFAAPFPWTPILGVFYFIIESRIEAANFLAFTQRLSSPLRAAINFKTSANNALVNITWIRILWLLSFLAIITNSYFIIFVSSAVSDIGLDSSSPENLLRYFIYSQYLFVVSIAIIVFVFRGETVSPTAHKFAQKQNLLANRDLQHYVVSSLKCDPEILKKQLIQLQKQNDEILEEQRKRSAENHRPQNAPNMIEKLFLTRFCVWNHLGDHQNACAESQRQEEDRNLDERYNDGENFSFEGPANLREQNEYNSHHIPLHQQPPSASNTSTEQEKVLLQLSWQKLRQREHMYDVMMRKNEKSPSSNYRMPESAYATKHLNPSNNTYYSHISQSPPMRKIPGEKDDDFVDRVLAKDRKYSARTSSATNNNPFDHVSKKRQQQEVRKSYEEELFEL